MTSAYVRLCQKAIVALALETVGQLPATLDVDSASSLLHYSVAGVLSQWLLDPEEFDRVLESRGGTSNAYTSNDVTAYYEDFASDALEIS